MKKKGLEPYIQLVYFLGEVLGPDYEISLQDVRKKEHSLVAIVNNHISGRETDSPLTDLVLKVISEKIYLEKDYIANYNGLVKNNTLVRSSTYFIKEEEELIGILCINFDSSRYQNLSKKILSLCHPDTLVEQNYNFNPNLSLLDIKETFSGSISDLIDSLIHSSRNGEKLSSKKLSKADRIKIVEMLEEKNVFMVKGAITQTAEKLSCSEATIYRYLNKINKNKKQYSYEDYND